MQISKIKEYNTQTTVNGIMMPTVSEFDKKVKFAILLWPQLNKNGEVEYLFGKGVGAELAIRGEVLGRKKREYKFNYRSHSDLEMYNVDGGYNKHPLSNYFVKVFGSQECYPKTATQALKNIPNSLMDTTYEVVSYNGDNYLIPNLEILFLDKYLKNEVTPRKAGNDAKCLLMSYQLNLNLIIEYYKEYYLKPEITRFKDIIDGAYERQLDAICNKGIRFVISLLKEDELPVTLKNIVIYYKRTILGFKGKGKIYNGIYFDYLPDNLDFSQKEDGSYDISDENKVKIKELIEEYKYSIHQKYVDKLNEIVNLYYEVYPTKKNENEL